MRPEEGKNNRKESVFDHKGWLIGFYAALLLFTLYVILDTFVIRRSYAESVTVNTALFDEMDAASSDAPESADSLDQISSNGEEEEYVMSDEISPDEDSPESVFEEGDYDYADENIRIKITQSREYETEIYAAEIWLSSAQYLKTAFAEDTYGKNIVQVTSEIANAHHAILAVNGDYYGVRERGYVIRNGVDYPRIFDIYDILCIFADGRMEAFGPEEYTSEELIEMGAWQAFSFGPVLVRDGEIYVGESDEVAAAYPSNQRCALGMIEPNHFLFVVSDGRTLESSGLSLYELAGFMKDNGAVLAYNLDGGGSATFVFDGEVRNRPTYVGESIEERPISDIVYIGYE